jgi:glycogen(starch) synthase
MPLPVTHKLVDEDSDEILQFLVRRNLLNRKEDKVKMVYHPDFINSTNPLFGMDYSQFVRGCHLGIFPKLL